MIPASPRPAERRRPMAAAPPEVRTPRKGLPRADRGKAATSPRRRAHRRCEVSIAMIGDHWIFRATAAAPAAGSAAGSAHRDAVHPQRGLADADRDALAVLAAGADSGIERQVIAHHGDAVKIGRAVADQHGALDPRADLAVLDFVGLGTLEDIF